MIIGDRTMAPGRVSISLGLKGNGVVKYTRYFLNSRFK